MTSQDDIRLEVPLAENPVSESMRHLSEEVKKPTFGKCSYPSLLKLNLIRKYQRKTYEWPPQTN